jgi:hypothetical protein
MIQRIFLQKYVLRLNVLTFAQTHRSSQCPANRSKVISVATPGFELETPRLSHRVQSVWSRLRLKCDGTRAETRFLLSAKRRSPFKSAGASVQSNACSRDVRISGGNAGYTMFRGSVKGTGYTHHSLISPSLPRHRVPSHFNWTVPNRSVVSKSLPFMQPAAPYRVHNEPSADPMNSASWNLVLLWLILILPWRLGVQLPVGTRDITVLRRTLTGSQAHQLLYQIASGIKATGAWSWPRTSIYRPYVD